jgi:hypothetical protein
MSSNKQLGNQGARIYLSPQELSYLSTLLASQSSIEARQVSLKIDKVLVKTIRANKDADREFLEGAIKLSSQSSNKQEEQAREESILNAALAGEEISQEDKDWYFTKNGFSIG